MKGLRKPFSARWLSLSLSPRWRGGGVFQLFRCEGMKRRVRLGEMTFSSVVESCNRAVGFGLLESALNGGELGWVSVRSWIDIGLGPDGWISMVV
ncbi:hypothetical protein TNCV_2154881 [Trichonephila clavipes]|nr:hypothetical protein TNCV_2154881 [Trichonephila clavipes]